MLSSHLIGVLLALTSAVVWGAGDFSGGVATRRTNQFQVLAVSALSGLAILTVLALVRSEAVPTPAGSLWAAGAGIAGAVGIAALYYGLSLGRAAVVAPTTAIVSIVLPVIFSIFTEGFPNLSTMLGFGLGMAGIWLVARSPSESSAASRRGLLVALLAGSGFGSFFILIAQVEPGAIFAPLVVSKAAALALALVLLRLRRETLPSLVQNPIALLAGTLDAGGNVFFLLARQFTRLDVASVLASMYATTTVILARLVLKERTSSTQWLGVVLCMIAIGLIVA
jgi:drug/metabolite transporter (DMT)-like permease